MIFTGIDPGKSGSMFLWDLGPDGTRRHFEKLQPPLAVVGHRKTPKGNVAEVKDYDVPALAQALSALIGRQSAVRPLRGVIERATTRPNVVRQTDALLTGKGYGLWLMGLAMLQVPLEEVDAARWKRDLFDPDLVPESAGLVKPPAPSTKLEPKTRNRLMNKRQAELKKNSCELARRLFPEIADWFKHHTTQDGVAEAALLAYWLWLKTRGLVK